LHLLNPQLHWDDVSERGCVSLLIDVKCIAGRCRTLRRRGRCMIWSRTLHPRTTSRLSSPPRSSRSSVSIFRSPAYNLTTYSPWTNICGFLMHHSLAHHLTTIPVFNMTLRLPSQTAGSGRDYHIRTCVQMLAWLLQFHVSVSRDLFQTFMRWMHKHAGDQRDGKGWFAASQIVFGSSLGDGLSKFARGRFALQ
jgi:hypothetical protein